MRQGLVSPALAHECPDTPRLSLPCKPRVRAGLYTPRGLHSKGALTHAPVEAPYSVLAVDTVEERLCPCKSRSTMLRAGDRQLRAASWPHQPQGATRLSVRPHRNAFPSGEPREGAGHGGCARATPKRTPPSEVSRTWSSRARPQPGLGEDKGMKVVSTSRGAPERRDSGA